MENVERALSALNLAWLQVTIHSLDLIQQHASLMLSQSQSGPSMCATLEPKALPKSPHQIEGPG
eukprot:1159163-Pelagomonas_calceolata.AAC.4